MVRLIDADALIERLRDDPLYEFIEQYGVTGVIKAEPKVDAVPVVRCRHCKYCDYDTAYGVIIPGTEFCTLTQDYCIDENDFCSRGVEAE